MCSFCRDRPCVHVTTGDNEMAMSREQFEALLAAQAEGQARHSEELLAAARQGALEPEKRVRQPLWASCSPASSAEAQQVLRQVHQRGELRRRRRPQEVQELRPAA